MIGLVNMIGRVQGDHRSQQQDQGWCTQDQGCPQQCRTADEYNRTGSMVRAYFKICINVSDRNMGHDGIRREENLIASGASAKDQFGIGVLLCSLNPFNSFMIYR